ncbi:molybdopterin-binding/glycosyltransferase family 2 protein [Mesorhizobium sp. SB112]|uniref:molybdopterin-binding/glycosyltransferase family 2 protein n=2 Tax=Pseudomonadota TaxID=1224 RepID=UPI003266F68E
MKFGPVSIEKAEGGILAHTLVAGDIRFRKSHRLTAADIAAIRAAGIQEVIVALLDPDDLAEDDAAETIVTSLSFDNLDAKPASTGRVNIYAAKAGVFVVDKALVDAINGIDPAITLATLPQFAHVENGQMAATVKIIPFAVASEKLRQVAALCAGKQIFSVHPFKPMKVGLIQTTLPGTKASVLDKTTRITQSRLARSSSQISSEQRPPHESGAVSQAIGKASAGNDMVIVFGASAMSDCDDVVPAAIRQAGGTVMRCGMPVDPGNLLVLGEIDGKFVIGAPGCARSPKENGFDWVLDRLIAGVPVNDADIAAMGVGGLLMEIPNRPQPREAKQTAGATVDAIILAAGRSSRMGGPNKLLALFDGEPLARRMAERALASKAQHVHVVTGHQADAIRSTLDGLDVEFVHNADFASGLSSSLKAGITALSDDTAGVLVVLGDMPGVTTEDFDRMIAAFEKSGGLSVVRAVHNGKRGNPVLLPRALFPELATLEGDTGARHIVESGDVPVVDVEIGAAATLDVDTRDLLESAGGVLQG